MNFTSYKTGLVFSEQMMLHKDETTDSFQFEIPLRLSEILRMLDQSNLITRCLKIEARSATQEELMAVHDKDHVLSMHSTMGKSADQLKPLADQFNSIFLNGDSYSSAALAAGCVLQAVDAVVQGCCLSAVAVVRPPGHHANKDSPCGFCIFNNVAVAAKHALNKYNLQRIMILDWDIHHGNGTQEIFESDDRILFISIHRFNNGHFYPSCMNDIAAANATPEYVGKGRGKGYSVNIAWNKSKMTNADYAAAFENVVLPIGREFEPEIVIVSAGFDAAVGDPLGGCRVTPEMFAQMTRWLQELANGRVVLALEGGYNIRSTAKSIVLCTETLLGDDVPKVKKFSPSPSALQSIKNTQESHYAHWTSLARLVGNE